MYARSSPGDPDDGTRGPHPPGPPARRGLVSNLRYYASFAADPIEFVQRRFDAYGDIYYAPNADGGLYVLRHPDHIREVLLTRAADFGKQHTALARMAQVLGDGLLVTDGPVWKRHRRMIQPVFHKPRLRGYAATMVGEAVRQADSLVDGEPVEMSAAMMRLTLRVVSRSLFSYDVDAHIDDVSRVMATFQAVSTRPDFTPRWLPSRQRRKLREATEALDRLMYGMIERRRATRTDAAPSDAPPDLLEMLLRVTDDEGDGAGLTDREIRDQLVTLFLAGHETTSHALTWTWYLLSQNPDAEAALHAELAEQLGGRAPGFDDLDRLPYTRRVFEEAMRLYPPAYAIARRALVDTQIGDWPVPRGSEVVMWVYMTHRDSRWYPDPEAFRPERFEPEAVSERPKQAYLPFGAGARACIGKLFAMVEGTLLIATLAQRHRFELAPGLRVAVRPRVTLLPKYGMQMIARAR